MVESLDAKTFSVAVVKVQKQSAFLPVKSTSSKVDPAGYDDFAPTEGNDGS